MAVEKSYTTIFNICLLITIGKYRKWGSSMSTYRGTAIQVSEYNEFLSKSINFKNATEERKITQF